MAKPELDIGTKATRTRARILTAAANELIERDGNLEIATVAARCDVSQGLIYRYFDSKTALIAAVVDDFYDRYDQAVMDIDPLPGAVWAERERLRTKHSIEFYNRDALARIILLNRQKEPQVSLVEIRRLKAHIELGVQNIQIAQKKGEIPTSVNPEIASPMIMGGLREVIVQKLEGRLILNEAELLDELMKVILSIVELKASTA